MTPPDRGRPWALFVLAVYATLGAIVALVPRPIDRGFTPWVRGTLAFLREHGLAGWITYDLVEYASHVVLFVPFGILAAVAFGRRLAWLAVLLALGVSALVEFAPSLWIEDHSPSPVDLLLNIIGAVGGVVVGYWAAPPSRPSRSRRRPSRLLDSPPRLR
ncbi:VanZ family protein [Agromyces bauzanensis]